MYFHAIHEVRAHSAERRFVDYDMIIFTILSLLLEEFKTNIKNPDAIHTPGFLAGYNLF
jgi:hypothetical protein